MTMEKLKRSLATSLYELTRSDAPIDHRPPIAAALRRALLLTCRAMGEEEKDEAIISRAFAGLPCRGDA